ncbi:hypothetical protein DPMN_013009 [Dreissena polymorpha]|uniref:SET domain-containing protein n=1 Tax=Dreissena polymorpha TaxID=45954 RepID=A0A9D4N848_DREPO|nr:hypothetical protein DPMN_013009 [Dreissena polymorpha]
MTTRQCCPCKRRGRTFRERRKSHSRPTSCSEDGSIVELCKWMKAAAGFKCPLSPANFQDTGRGLQTKSTIRSGEIIIALPKKLLITNQTAFQSDIGPYLKKWRPLLLPQACLSMFLLWERRKQTDSHWFPYINSLPATFNTPPYLTDKEISCLPDSVQKSAFKEKWKVSTVYEQIESHCKLHWTEFFDILDFETFRWCWSVINTRSVYLDGGLSEYLNKSEPNNIALAPYLDLINHSPSARIKADYNSMSGCYEITTYDCYRPYDQVFISYGFHSNGRLLVDYGFCVPGNHCDEVQISEGKNFIYC